MGKCLNGKKVTFELGMRMIEIAGTKEEGREFDGQRRDQTTSFIVSLERNAEFVVSVGLSSAPVGSEDVLKIEVRTGIMVDRSDSLSEVEEVCCTTNEVEIALVRAGLKVVPLADIELRSAVELS